MDYKEPGMEYLISQRMVRLESPTDCDLCDGLIVKGGKAWVVSRDRPFIPVMMVLHYPNCSRKLGMDMQEGVRRGN